MPSSIPYDPSLILGSVVSEAARNNIVDIAQAQAPVDAAQDVLKSLMASKRNLEMTKTELKNLGVSTASLDADIKRLDADIEKASATWATTKLSIEPQTQKLRADVRAVHSSVESPVDQLKTEIKSMPLAAESLDIDVHYVPVDSNSQTASSFPSRIAACVSDSARKVFGPDESSKLAKAASTQASRQVSQHNIDGTLVLSVNCTHKNANVLAPFILHPDKAIKVWNHLFPSKKLDPTQASSMMKIATNESQECREKFSVVSGVTFGSSFVGMVHVLNDPDVSTGEILASAARYLQATIDTAGWHTRADGRTGMSSQFASEVKNLLSQQNISSHVTLLTMGVFPSVVSNDINLAVQDFTKFDPVLSGQHTMALQDTVDGEQSRMQSMAEASRTRERSSGVQDKTSAAVSATAAIDDDQNKSLDINGMLSALEDYLKKALNGDCGIPINYYLKDVDAKMLAEMWLAKYYPGKFMMSIKYDDTEGDRQAGSADEREKAPL